MHPYMLQMLCTWRGGISTSPCVLFALCTCREQHMVKIVPLAADSSSMQGNPVKMTHDEIAAVIRQAL